MQMRCYFIKYAYICIHFWYKNLNIESALESKVFTEGVLGFFFQFVVCKDDAL